ncbi:MAG: hypothetical protein JSS89_12920 [Bacteroidetes bacterium]|nr:hypothetical protein [Bacteroidota bacterium]
MMPVLLWWKRVAPWLLVVVFALQAVTGVLLSMLYVPSEQPVYDERGRVRAFAYATGLVRIQPTSRADVLDTVTVAPRPILVPLDTSGRVADLYEADARHCSLIRDASGAPLVPSAAAASVVLTIGRDAPGGDVVRWLHHVNTVVLLLMLALTMAAYLHAVDGRLAWGTVAVGIALCAAYTGRLLPDDVYALVSRSITSDVFDHDAPFGWLIARILGVTGPTVHALSTTATMHTVVLPAVLTVVIVHLLRLTQVALVDVWRWILAVSIVGTLAYLLFHGTVPLRGEYMPRDTMHGAAVTSGIAPWWPFRLPNSLIAWFGAEMASYLTIGVFVALITMRWWQGSVGQWTVRIFIGMLLLTIILGSVL